MNTPKTIPPEDLICMNDHAISHTFRVDLVYARPDNLLFGERIYKSDARLWLYKDLAAIVLKAAEYCTRHHKARFILYDGLRTTDAQEKMMHTQRVQDNPHWLREPRLLSPPGAGGHPRGMAIDIGLESLDGDLLDMGTLFDFLAENPDMAHNPAHRDFRGHDPKIMENRRKLDNSMLLAAQDLNIPLLLLPQEWWDFRLPPETFNRFKPLSETDLPPAMRLI